MANCNICKKLLDQDGDDLSVNCGGDCRECMARAGDPDEMFATIEALIGEAYTIGYDHGMNPFRTEHGQPPERVGEGWGPVAERLWQILRDGANLSTRSSDQIAELEYGPLVDVIRNAVLDRNQRPFLSKPSTLKICAALDSAGLLKK